MARSITQPPPRLLKQAGRFLETGQSRFNQRGDAFCRRVEVATQPGSAASRQSRGVRPHQR